MHEANGARGLGRCNEGWSALMLIVLVLVVYLAALITIAIVLNVAASLLVRTFQR